MTKKSTFSFLICLALASANIANADIINYPNIESPGMSFTNITESSLDPLPLFGQPTIQDGSLVFDNPTFAVQTANAIDFIDGRMTVTVTSKTSDLISSFSIFESGEYEIIGSGTVAVSGVAFAVADNDIYQADFQFTTSDAGTGSWSRQIDIQFADPVGSFSLVMDNSVFGNSDDNSSMAAIQKNMVQITITETSVPEPTATTFGLLGLAVLASRRKR